MKGPEVLPGPKVRVVKDVHPNTPANLFRSQILRMFHVNSSDPVNVKQAKRVHSRTRQTSRQSILHASISPRYEPILLAFLLTFARQSRDGLIRLPGQLQIRRKVRISTCPSERKKSKPTEWNCGRASQPGWQGRSAVIPSSGFGVGKFDLGPAGQRESADVWSSILPLRR